MVAPVYFTGSIASTQDLFTVSEPLPNIFPNHISNVSKATTAVVTTSVAPTVSTTGTIGSIAGTGPYTAVITNMSSTDGLLTGQAITATAGTGNLGVGSTVVSSIIGSTSIGITSSATQNAGTITNIKTPAPITTAGLVDGDPILITGVSGMTQLATAGENDTNLFYANVTSATTFELYSDSALTANVDSSSFSNAVSNTGSYQTFTVTQYNTVASPQNVVFDNSITSSGTDIALDEATGIITLQDVNDYALTAVVNTTRPLPPTSNAGCQWFSITDDEYIGVFTKFGQPCTAIISVSAETEVVLRAFSDTGTFEYPNQLFDASFSVQLSVPV
jgi:hypothetical protein